MSLFHFNNYEDAPSRQRNSYKLHKLQPIFEAVSTAMMARSFTLQFQMYGAK
jgi:hypothetical protein